ncbi:MAG: QcrA and Rieske domain-containing protein [Gemmatimonadaceae bacterium]
MDEVRSCEHSCGLGRREFLGAAALTALALLETACGDGVIGGTAPSDTPSGTALVVSLANFPALATVGGAARVDGGSGRPVALVRTGTATFNAFSLVCTHEGTTVGLTGSGFLCPNHGARFSLSGVWQGGQVTTNLRTLTNSFDAAAGTVTVNR